MNSRTQKISDHYLGHLSGCLSRSVATPARLQNRACDFRRTRLLSTAAFVKRTSTAIFSRRLVVVTMSMEELKVSEGMRAPLTAGDHVVDLQSLSLCEEQSAGWALSLLAL